MFLYQPTKCPFWLQFIFFGYEMLAFYGFINIYYEYSDFTERISLSTAFFETDNIMSLLFNIPIAFIFSVLYFEIKKNLGDKLTYKLMRRIEHPEI